MGQKKLARVRRAVDDLGIALVYPLANKPDPPSLWAALYPGTPMRWDWDEGADPRVVELWHLRERLSQTSDVAYAKWFRGRATFFSIPVFHALLAELAAAGDLLAGLPRAAHDILDLLRDRSPLSTKEIRRAADLRGKANERMYEHAMKALATRLLVVGWGEVADGAFPSLAVGATELLHEDVWLARKDAPADGKAKLASVMASSPALAKEVARARDVVRAAVADDEL